MNLCFSSDFSEALKVTAAAKGKFRANEEDLLQRGRRLILDSVASGVTSMRAHVEVDDVVQFSCVEAGLELKQEMKDVCDVQISGPTLS